VKGWEGRCAVARAIMMILKDFRLSSDRGFQELAHGDRGALDSNETGRRAIACKFLGEKVAREYSREGLPEQRGT
jgi:hypothetical protein